MKKDWIRWCEYVCMIILFVAICFLYQDNRRIEKKLDDSIKQTTEANKMEHLYDHLTDSETPESVKKYFKTLKLFYEENDKVTDGNARYL